MGLGGCAVLGAGYAHLKNRWVEMRHPINGDPDAPLHASEMPRKPENFATPRSWWTPSFVRVAATTTKAIGLPLDMHPCVPVLTTEGRDQDKGRANHSSGHKAGAWRPGPGAAGR
jgi:hypothetical protein